MRYPLLASDILQVQIAQPELVGQRHTNSPTMVLELFTSAIAPPITSKLINASYNNSILLWRSTYDNSTPGVKKR